MLLSAAWAAALEAPLTYRFVYGLERRGGLPVLRELHLNTLYLDLLPSDLPDLDPARDLIRGAAAQGYQVIVGLPTTSPLVGQVAPGDARYRGSTAEMIGYCVGQLGREAGVTAWATGHFLERVLRFRDDDFRDYLQRGYGSLEGLNASWGGSFQTWLQVTQDAAREGDRGFPQGVGRGSVDVADFQAWAFHEVMAQWLRTIREHDGTRPVLTGRLSLYRSLPSVPVGYDTVCVSMPPDVLETDDISHNSQALDMARRGGRWRVLQVLRCPHPSTTAYSSDAFRAWLLVAALKGSAGYGVEDWDLLGYVYDLEKRMTGRKRITEAMQDAPRLTFGQAPLASSAILYQPYAAGREVTGQPTYGYLKGFRPGEPSGLIFSLRLGTRFGSVDFLTRDELLEVDLRQYGAILAPSCLRLPPRQSRELGDYISTGGALLADLGFGSYEGGGWNRFPDLWAELLGLAEVGEVGDRVGDFRVGSALRHLPNLHPGMTSRGAFTTGGQGSGTAPANARRTFTVAGPALEARLTETCVPVAPVAVRFDKERRPIFAGLLCNSVGSGFTVFATHALWQYWPLEDALATALHFDLMSRRPRFELVGVGLLPRQLCIAGNDQCLQVINLSRQTQAAEIWDYAAAGQVYRGGVTLIPASTAAGPQSGAVRVCLTPPGLEQRVAWRCPLQVRPVDREVGMWVEKYGPTGVAYTISGPGVRVQTRAGRDPELQCANYGAAQVFLTDGAYRVMPGSRHQVTRYSRGGVPQRMRLEADAQGRLDLSGSFRLDRVEIHPEAD